MEFSPIFCTQAKNMMFSDSATSIVCSVTWKLFFWTGEMMHWTLSVKKMSSYALLRPFKSKHQERKKRQVFSGIFDEGKHFRGNAIKIDATGFFRLLAGITMATSGIIKLGINLPQNLPSYQFVRDRSLILRFEKLYEMRCYEILVT